MNFRVNLVPHQLQKCVQEYGEQTMLNAANELRKSGALVSKDNPTLTFHGMWKGKSGSFEILETHGFEVKLVRMSSSKVNCVPHIYE